MERVQDRIKELWKLQLQLNKFVGETEAELDASVAGLFPNDNRPDWFNSGIVFSPLIIAFDNQIQDEQDEIYDLQQEVLRLMKEREKKIKEENEHDEEEIIALHKSIDISKHEIEELEANVNPPMSFEEKKAQFYEEEVKRAQETYKDLVEENTKLEEVLQEWLIEVERATSEYVAACSDLKRNEAIAQQYRREIKEMRNLKEKYEQTKDYHSQKVENMENVVSRMLAMREQNAKKILELEEECAKHQELITSFNNIQIMINESGVRQNEAIQQMLDAFDLNEKATSQFRKHHVNCEICQEEMGRIKSFTEDAKRKFDMMVDYHDTAARNYFEPFLAQVSRRTAILMEDHARLLREKESVERQLEIAGRSRTLEPEPHTMDLLLQFKSQLEEKHAQKGKLMHDIVHLRNSITEMHSSLLAGVPSKRRELAQLRKRRQELELEMGVAQTQLGDAITKNAALRERNASVEGQIKSTRAQSNRASEQALKDLEIKIQKMQDFISTVENENAFQIKELEESITRVRIEAEQNQEDARRAKGGFSQARKSSQSEADKLKKQCKAMKKIIDGNKTELDKGRRVMRDATEQVSLLKAKIKESLEKEARQSRLIERLASEQVVFAAENEQFETILKETSERLADKRAQIQRLGQSQETGDLVEMEYGVDII